jgi:uncharacterized membrane protein YccC
MSDTPEGAVPVDEAAAAFEELRQEIALMRRAVAGLSAEHASIEVPDYSQTLGKMAAAINAILRTNKDLAEAPALRMTAQNWAEHIAAASQTARQADRDTLDRARSVFDEMARAMSASLDSARTANRQLIWVLCAAGGGLAVGIMVGVMIARLVG